ncbi:MAG: hypothetical protein ABIQ44_01990, partial [Chloroflexia bacterium]
SFFAILTSQVMPSLVRSRAQGWLFRLYGVIYGLSALILTLYIADIIVTPDMRYTFFLDFILPDGPLSNQPIVLGPWILCSISFAIIGFILTTWLLAKQNATHHTLRVFGLRIPF